MWGTMRSTASNVFHFVMIKPSHYDDDGYPIQWIRSAIPSNTLACLNALAEDARRREILGPDVDIQLHTYDETNRRVRPDRIIRTIRKSGGRALIGLVGVQSNQFPRAIDLARPFLAAGLPVWPAGSTCPAASPCCPNCRPISKPRRRWASHSSPANAKTAGSMTCCWMAGTANSSPSTTTWTTCRRSPASRRPSFRSSTSSARRARLKHGSRPRLSLPMLVLHHHQCAGPQEPLPQSG